MREKTKIITQNSRLDFNKTILLVVLNINIHCNLGKQETFIFTKHDKRKKFSTYNDSNAVKFPRLGGISPTNWLPLRYLFLFGDRAIEREKQTHCHRVSKQDIVFLRL